MKQCPECKGSGLRVIQKSNHPYDAGARQLIRCPKCKGSGVKLQTTKQR